MDSESILAILLTLFIGIVALWAARVWRYSAPACRLVHSWEDDDDWR